MPENNLYYIYIDSKIEGTIDQLLSYFQADIFHADDCICIYFKFYKDIEKYIHKRFKNTSIRYKFMRKNSDFSFQKNKVVFYLFNAQSNCRVVANRDLVHVFVTHGESHKLASIKPIIRIYDFVITSGQVGIDRLLKAGIFNLHNIDQEYRVITMGDTFIGQNCYQFSVDSKSLLYAPTWEGGVLSENYSSVGMQATQVLVDIIQRHSIQKLYIQSHPNLGHRDKKYIQYLYQMILAFKKLAIDITLVKSQPKLSDRWNYRGCKVMPQTSTQNITVAAAVVDISAMEMQLINREIPTLVLFNEQYLKELVIPNRVKYLYTTQRSLEHFDFKNFSFNQQSFEIQKHQHYLIDYCEEHLKNKSFRQRIQWLCQFAPQKKNQLRQHCMDTF